MIKLKTVKIGPGYGQEMKHVAHWDATLAILFHDFIANVHPGEHTKFEFKSLRNWTEHTRKGGMKTSAQPPVRKLERIQFMHQGLVKEFVAWANAREKMGVK